MIMAMSKSSPYNGTHRMLREIVLEAAGFRCHWCGGPANTADHLLPIADGGTNELSNYVASCKSCNSRRSMRALNDRKKAAHLNTSRQW
jgi:5-methylcytosine-specific restriction endonuclease McrA